MLRPKSRSIDYVAKLRREKGNWTSSMDDASGANAMESHAYGKVLDLELEFAQAVLADRDSTAAERRVAKRYIACRARMDSTVPRLLASLDKSFRNVPSLHFTVVLELSSIDAYQRTAWAAYYADRRQAVAAIRRLGLLATQAPS